MTEASLYQSGYKPRGIRKEWAPSAVSNEDAEQAIRRRCALKSEVHVTDAVSWWRAGGTLAVLVADLTTGSRIIYRQAASGRHNIDFEVSHD